MSKKIVIIGAVAAGPKAACRLKRLRPDWEITMIDQDSLISYGGCGIPYYISGDVSDESELRATSFHVVRDAAFFEHSKGVRVRTRTRALAIDRKAKTVRVEHLDSGAQEELPYDQVLLATGSRPIELPIPGRELDGVFMVSDLGKAIEIKSRIAQGKVSRVVVIGGGAIGIEMAEAFHDLWGLETALLELQPQLLPRLLDRHFAIMLKKHLVDKGVVVHTGESAEVIVDNGQGQVAAVRTGKRTLEADLVVMAVGVRPRSELAREAGLNITPFGGIKVNQRLQTSDPSIFAAGDCIAETSLLTGKESYTPLGSLANREGRIVADNMAGRPVLFREVLGSFIIKAFERCVASTGLTLEIARAEGFDADLALISQADRAHFYPGQAVMLLQLVFDRRSRRVLGMQAFGMMNDAISARVNAAAGLIGHGATIEDFEVLETAYAPPFSSAIDLLNAAAYVADNLCENRMRQVDLPRFMQWLADMDSEPDWVALDLRHPAESTACVEKFGSERWRPLEYGQVRARHPELSQDKTYILICGSGPRAYEVQVFLDHIGMVDTLVLPGGMNVITRLGMI